jgi:glycosyltransferase involved in cell wall biosynthesis
MTDLTVVASYGRTAGSARVRMYDWLDHLGLRAREYAYLGTSRLGLGALARRPLDVARAEAGLRRIGSGDGPVLLSRRASPLSRGGLEARILGRARRGVYDFDDALAVDSRSPFPIATIWRRAVSAADVVIAGNELLAEQAREHSDRVVMIPSCIEPGLYRAKTDYRLGEPTAVWIGSPSTESYLEAIARPLLEAHRRTGLRLRLVSAGEASLGELDAMIDRVAWTPTGFAAALESADFGVMPLPDDEWSRGKCAYKLLQYAATGLPLIGSPVGVNASVLEGARGWAADGDDAWLDALLACVSASSAERADRGAAARAFVTAEYSFAAWAPTWRAAVFGDAEA